VPEVVEVVDPVVVVGAVPAAVVEVDAAAPVVAVVEEDDDPEEQAARAREATAVPAARRRRFRRRRVSVMLRVLTDSGVIPRGPPPRRRPARPGKSHTCHPRVTLCPHSSIDSGGQLMSTQRGFRKAAVATMIGVMAVVGAACSSNSSSSTTTTKASTTTTTASPALPTTVIPSQPADATLSASVPASVKSTGTLTIALDATYAPDEFIAPDGSTIVGMDADLANAITQTMGLQAKLVNATFDTIIPGIVSGKYGMGASSFTDTVARQKVVDFVDYFNAGEGFYTKSGSSLSFASLSDLCGHSVSVESGTTEETDAKAQSVKCTATGKPKVTVLTFSTQSEANLAVSSGRADVGFADSPVAAYIVATSNGVFQNSGTSVNNAPYGLALPKGNGMAAPVQASVNALIANGVYHQILVKWGVQSGAIAAATINGATS
jgi:polar amino acid transport system substrate-binding protein